MRAPSRRTPPNLEFSPVPAAERGRPARTPQVSTRLYVERIAEHLEVYQFVQDMQTYHGAGVKAIVRALLHYRDDVIGTGPSPAKPGIALRDLTPLPRNPSVQGRGAEKNLSARLSIDKWVEHRDAFTFIQDTQELHGDGGKILVRALLHYRDSFDFGLGSRGSAQMTFDVPGLRR